MDELKKAHRVTVLIGFALILSHFIQWEEWVKAVDGVQAEE